MTHCRVLELQGLGSGAKKEWNFYLWNEKENIEVTLGVVSQGLVPIRADAM